MHILLRQLSALESSQLLALPLSRKHTRPSFFQRLLTNKEPEHIKTNLILNDSVIFIFKITVTQTCLAFLLCEKRFYTAQLF